MQFLKLKEYTVGEMTIAQSIQYFTCALSNKFLNFMWRSHRTPWHRLRHVSYAPQIFLIISGILLLSMCWKSQLYFSENF